MFTFVVDNTDRERSLTEQDIEESVRYRETQEFWLDMKSDLSAK